MLEAAGWPAPDVSRVSLAVGEAVSNAVEHGPARLDPIRVHLERGRDRMTVYIQDGGSGPPSELIRTARLPDDPLALGGRGLYILTQLADSIQCEDDGGLLLTFRRRS